PLRTGPRPTTAWLRGRAGHANIVCHRASLYKAPRERNFPLARCRKGAALSGERWAGLGKVEKLSTHRKRAFHERAPARIFSRQASGVEGRDPARIEDHAADAPGGERQPS